MIFVRIDRETELSYDADQAQQEPDGTLKLYKWTQIGRYVCPLNKTLVETLAPGKWASFSKDK